MSGSRPTVREYYRCIPVDLNLLGVAFKELAALTRFGAEPDVVRANVEAAVRLADRLRFRTDGYRTEEDPVRVLKYDGFCEPDSPFEWLQLTAYSVDDGQFLLRVHQGHPPVETEQSYELQLARALNVPRALQSVVVDFSLPVVDADGQQFRCDLAPLVETLASKGFHPCWPHSVSAMTGRAAAGEVGRQLPSSPRRQGLLFSIEPGSAEVAEEQWRQDVTAWRPKWSFADASYLYVTAEISGCRPAQVKTQSEHAQRRQCEAELPYTVDGSVLSGLRPADSSKLPTLWVTVQRYNAHPYHPYPLLLTDSHMKAQARELAATLAATIRMN